MDGSVATAAATDPGYQGGGMLAVGYARDGLGAGTPHQDSQENGNEGQHHVVAYVRYFLFRKMAYDIQAAGQRNKRMNSINFEERSAFFSFFFFTILLAPAPTC